MSEMVGEAPRSPTRYYMMKLRDECLWRAEKATGDDRDAFYDAAMNCARALAPQYLPDHILEATHRAILAEYSFADAIEDRP